MGYDFELSKNFRIKFETYYQMLSNITQKSNPSYAIIYFANKFQNTKALGNQTKRKFFAIGQREQQPIMNVFMKEYNKLSKI